MAGRHHQLPTFPPASPADFRRRHNHGSRWLTALGDEHERLTNLPTRPSTTLLLSPTQLAAVVDAGYIPKMIGGRGLLINATFHARSAANHDPRSSTKSGFFLLKCGRFTEKNSRSPKLRASINFGKSYTRSPVAR